MTPEPLDHLIAVYGAGLDTEVALLGRLSALSSALDAAATERDVASVESLTDERGRVMATLLAVEHELHPTRQQLWERRHEAAPLPAFQAVAATHRRASDLVGAIMSSDRQVMEALRTAETARREAAQDLEVGETTLAAYRRVVAPAVAAASLMDRRG